MSSRELVILLWLLDSALALDVCYDDLDNDEGTWRSRQTTICVKETYYNCTNGINFIVAPFQLGITQSHFSYVSRLPR